MSPKVDLISFTGSTVVGKRIIEKGAATMKRLFLELGGKSATIVLEDADCRPPPCPASPPCVHAGQGCAIPTRMLLPRSRYDEGVDLLKRLYEAMQRRRPAGARHASRVRSSRPSSASGCAATSSRASTRGRTLLVGGTEPPPGFDKGLLRQADALRRRRQLEHDRPGGDLRTGAGGDPVRRRRGRDPHRQRQPLRTVRQRRLGLARAVARGRSPFARRRHRRERRGRLRCRRAVRRIQGQRDRPPERSRGLRPVPRDQVGGVARPEEEHDDDGKQRRLLRPVRLRDRRRSVPGLEAAPRRSAALLQRRSTTSTR